jgi:hypothetical protein
MCALAFHRQRGDLRIEELPVGVIDCGWREEVVLRGPVAGHAPAILIGDSHRTYNSWHEVLFADGMSHIVVLHSDGVALLGVTAHVSRRLPIP